MGCRPRATQATEMKGLQENLQLEQDQSATSSAECHGEQSSGSHLPLGQSVKRGRKIMK